MCDYNKQIKEAVLEIVENLGYKTEGLKDDEKGSVKEIIDIDSIDVLKFIILIEEKFKIDCGLNFFNSTTRLCDILSYIEARYIKD